MSRKWMKCSGWILFALLLFGAIITIGLVFSYYFSEIPPVAAKILNSPLFQTLAGALAALGGSWYTSHAARKEKDKENVYLQIALVQVLRDEVTILWRHLQETLGPSLNTVSDNQLLLQKIRGMPTPNEDYFIIYTQNASSIGHIEDEKLREDIITTYIYAKALFDSWRATHASIVEYENRNQQSTTLPAAVFGTQAQTIKRFFGTISEKIPLLLGKLEEHKNSLKKKKETV